MGNLLGEPFRPYVNSQIKIRQQVHGSGTNNINRTLDEIAYLNSRNAWVKFASAVYIDEKRLQLLKNSSKDSLVNPMVENALEGFDLAIKNVLYNGLTPFTADGYSSQDAKDFTESFNKNLRYKFKTNANKFVDYNSNLNKSGIEGFQGTTRDFAAYGVGGINFGFSPMPGITSVNIKDLNRGSIKKATINIKAHNRNQFDVIDLLYLRLGYTVCLEYGNNIYFDYEPEGSDNKVLKKVEDTLIDRYFWTTIRESYADFSDKINNKREEYKGNYDGIIGVVSNFNWSFESDGTYNITVEVTSVGDVIESLRVNLPPLIDVATSANLQGKYEELKKKLAEEQANEPEFYGVLYKGLKPQLEKIYDILTNGGTKAIFKYGFDRGNPNPVSIDFEDPSIKSQLLIDPVLIELEEFRNQIQDSIFSKDASWILDFYRRGFGGLNGDPLRYTTSEQAQVLIYNEDGTIRDPTPLIGNTEEYKKLSWLDDKKLNFRNQNPGADFYTVVGLDRNSKKTFRYDRRGLGYFKSDLDLLSDKEEIRQGQTKFWVNLTDSERNLAFPKIFSKSSFLTLFFEKTKPIRDFNPDTALSRGGKKDKTLNPPSSVEEKSPLETFRNKLETGKYKNKINNWFYNIRKYYSSAFLLEEGDSKGERAFGKIQMASLEKIYLNGGKYSSETSTEGIEIGYRLNPIPSGIAAKGWDEEVKFPLSTSLTCDLVKLKITPIEHSYFVRLGTLLEYIQNKIIFKMDSVSKNSSSSPYFNIDTNIKTNICYAIDNMISTNVKKCIIKNDKFFVGATEGEGGNQETYANIFKGLEPFFPTSNNTGYFYGQLMNVYLNFNRIEEIFNSVDEKNEIVLFDVLKAICNDINECLGSVNNIEPIIDRESNTIKLIDQTSIPGLDIIASQLGDNIYEERKRRKEEQEELIVFGYNQNNDKSNFIRSVGMTTEISKNYATAITIGATAQGEVPGMEATAFSRWNVGIRDRFKNRLFDAETPQDEINSTGTGSLDKQNKSVINNYADFISDGYVTLGLNKPDSIGASINDGYISENKNTIKNYYVYAQAKTTEENYKEEGDEGAIESSIGFLPINLKLEMDGIGGIRIYDFVKINTAFLPSNYPNTLEFICTGVNHKLENDEWITSLDTLATSISKKT
jgi:hypothetical protein